MKSRDKDKPQRGERGNIKIRDNTCAGCPLFTVPISMLGICISPRVRSESTNLKFPFLMFDI